MFAKTEKTHKFLIEEYMYFARAENVVDILEKSFVLDLIVSEYERNAFAFAAGSAIEKLEIFDEV